MSRKIKYGALLLLATLIVLGAMTGAARSSSGKAVATSPIIVAATVTPASIPSATAFQANTFSVTLQRARDYRRVGGDVDCPSCKDLYCAQLPLNGGTTFVSVRYMGGRPTTNNHWYRCQEQARCGLPEFSYPSDVRLGCAGKNACQICRATDDGIGSYEDDLEITTR